MSRLERILFYLFLFSIPFQTRYILVRWTEPFNEWTAGFIFLTDILLLAILTLWALRSWKGRGRVSVGVADFLLLGFIAVALLSISKAVIPSVSWFRFLKLLEFAGLYYYIKHNLKLFNTKVLLKIVFFSALMQSAIAILQSVLQSSLGFKILGESVLVLGSPGIAVFYVKAELFLRAYGTTPHPNILAAWLFLGLGAFYILYCSGGVRLRYWLIAYVPLLLGFFLTFSRVILGLWFLMSLLMLAFVFIKRTLKQDVEKYSKRIAHIFLLTLLVGIVFLVSYWPHSKARIQISRYEEAVQHRVFFSNLASDISKDNSILGVGHGQFIPHLMDESSQVLQSEEWLEQILFYPQTYLYQPAHNIYLLISSEIGTPGIIIFVMLMIYLFYDYYKHSEQDLRTYFVLFIVFSFLMFGFFDHFLWTLQQGSLMLWMLLGILAAGPKGKYILDTE